MVLFCVGLVFGKQFKVGDLDSGVLELCVNLVYNQDDWFIFENYSVSFDVMVVMVKIDKNGIVVYDV